MNLCTSDNMFKAVFASLKIAKQTSTACSLLVARLRVPTIEMQPQVGKVHSWCHSAAKPKKVLARSARDPTPLRLGHETHTAASKANVNQKRCAPPLLKLQAQNFLHSSRGAGCKESKNISYATLFISVRARAFMI